MRRAFALSLLAHVAICLAALSGGALTLDETERDARLITSELTVEEAVAPPSVEGDDGKSRAGIEQARPTGQADRDSRGRAGDREVARASGVHRVGESDRERVTALAETLGALARVESPTRPTGTREEATDGLTSSGSLVSPGARGLDMVGTGHGSGPRGEEGLGDRAPGLGSLGASHPFASTGRGVGTRALCITPRVCPHRERRWMLWLRVLSGPLDERRAESVARRVRAQILACSIQSGVVDLVIASDGRVIASSSDVPCIESVLRTVSYPAAPSASRVVIRMARVQF